MKTRKKFALFSPVLGCWLIAAMLGAALQPASAARPGTRQAATPQDHRHDMPLAAGSVLELRDGQMACRPATQQEARAMQQRPAQELHVLHDNTPTFEATPQVQQGMKIVLRGTAQLEQFPAAKAAFLRAARAWEALIQNRITVVIDVDFGPTSFGKPFRENEYGNTRFQWNFKDDYYPTIRSALIQSAGSPQEAALYNALLPTALPTDLGAATRMTYHVAPLRALNVLPPVADPEKENLGLPPGIAFNSGTPFDFDPNDGIAAKHYDFTATAMHEIGHALGFFSTVGITEESNTTLLSPDMLDMFRFRPGVTSATFATAPRILSSGGEHVFFGGGPELALSTGRIDATGGDERQAGHWKDDGLTGKYIGIMDPIFGWGRRYDLTANDRAAFELLGYRTNPLPAPDETELKLDDGIIDGVATNDGWIVLTRMTPPSYPATLRKMRILIPAFDNWPNPTGKPITLWYGHLNAGGSFKRLETTVPSASGKLFLEFPLPDGPTINSGDFLVGFQSPRPFEGVSFAADLSGTAEPRTLYSTDNGASFLPFSVEFQGKPANAMIRAIVSTLVPPPPPPTPTPSPATVALSSGVPHHASMTRAEPYGALSETQYTIQVPSGATELKVELNANTDMDLYARFGSRLVIKEELPVADFKSVSDENHESITITPTSSPALKEGVYYLMVVNYGPGPSNFTITATVNAAPTPRKVTSVSAASYDGAALASESIASAFGEKLATTTQETPAGRPLQTQLGGTQVMVKDSQGVERAALLFYVSPYQVNYLVPPGTAIGLATVTVTSGDGTISVGTAEIAKVAPGFFTANADGKGVPAAWEVRYSGSEEPQLAPVFQHDATQGRFVPRPLDLGEATDQVFLSLFGTGLRQRQDLSAVSVKIGGVEVPVLYAGDQKVYVGLDQVNIRLPRSLMGRGAVDLVLTVEGKTANTVKINIK